MDSTKTCKTCEQILSLDLFYSRKRPNGNITYSTHCVECTKLNTQKWSTDNKKRKAANDKKWRENNKERKAATDKAWREANPERKKENDKNWRENNKEHIQYYKRNTVQYKIRDKWSKRLWALIKKGHWSSETADVVGIEKKQMLMWLEFQFDTNMTYENYGTYWQIDHVTPCYMFDLEDDAQLRKCFSWKNTRPLQKTKNLSKGKKLVPYEQVIQELKVYHYNNI